MADQWYYQMFGQEFGPVEFTELLSLRNTGSLSGSDNVRRESEAAYMSLDDALQTNMGSAVIAERSESDLSIDDFYIEGREEPVPEREMRFYVRSNGTTIGPLTSEDFCRLADAGKIDVQDEIRCNNEDWRSASESPEVMAAQLISGSGKIAPLANSPAKLLTKKRKTNGQNRKPKKRRPKVDDELQDVFDEIFAPNGTLNQKGEPKDTADPNDTPALTSSETMKVANGRADTAQVMAVVPMSTPPAAFVMPTATQTQKPAKPWTPPPKRKKSLSERFDFDRRTLSIIGGIVGVISLGCLIPFIGMSSLFGATVPNASSVETMLNDNIAKYESVKSSDSEWKSFAAEVRSTVGEIVKGYREASGQCGPRDLELKQAATCLIQLANCRRDDTAKHEELLSDFRKNLNGKS